MLRTSVLRSWGCVAVLLTLGLLGCYDGQRDNPFDPALTPAVELVSAAVEDTTGSAILGWTEYAGRQPFAAYWVLRKERDRETVDTLKVIEDVHRTTFRDTTLAPDVEYVYWITVVNQSGFEVPGDEKSDVSYELPSVELRSADFSSDSATAELIWTAYRGPGFEIYEVRRRTVQLVEQTVGEITDIANTTYTDTLLDGNTEYVYRIYVRTTWDGVGVFSNEQSGKFHPLYDVRALPISGYDDLQAVDLAVDEHDGLYVAATTILRTTAHQMQPGIQVAFPGETIRFTRFFEKVHPHRSSPIRIAAGGGRMYVSLTAEDDTTFVAALDEDRVLWRTPVDTGGAFPVGLHLQEDGTVLLVDDQGMLHPFSQDGRLGNSIVGFQRTLVADRVLPLRHVVVGPGVGRSGKDHFFFVTTERGDHHVFVSARSSEKLFGSTSWLDEGIGVEDGQTVSPVAMAFDQRRSRLLVLDSTGRLQVFDARPEDLSPRYITKWGGSGRGEEKFQISLSIRISMAVDSEGMIYVADGPARVQVFSP